MTQDAAKARRADKPVQLSFLDICAPQYPNSEIPAVVSPPRGATHSSAGQSTATSPFVGEQGSPEEVRLVSDSKPEFSQATSMHPNGQIGGMLLLPQGNPMILTTYHINNLQNGGDRQPLRDAVRLMSHYDLALRAFAKLEEDAVADLITKFVNGSDINSVRASMANPGRLARRILYALSRLSLQFPDDGFPRVTAPEAKSNPPLTDADKPARLNQQMSGWKPRLRGQEPGTGTGKPVKPETAVGYERVFWKVVQLCILAGMDINDFVSIELLTSATALDRLLPILRNHYAKSTIAPVLAALERILTDLLGPHHPNVPAFKEAVRKNFHSLTLPVDEIDELRDAAGRNADETDVITIWDLPSAIEHRADARRLSPSDRDSRRSCATALEILLAIPAVPSDALARVNLEADIKREGEWTLSYHDSNGHVRTDKLSKKAHERVLALEGFRQRVQRSSPWLFAGKCRLKAQERRVAMNALATNIQMTAGRRFTVVQIRDAIVVNAIDGGQVDAKTISDGIHQKDPRSAQRRFRIPLERPLEGEQGNAG